MLSQQQERIRMLPILIEREKDLEKVLELAAELGTLLADETDHGGLTRRNPICSG